MDNKFAILSKMLIKCKDRMNFESFHYSKSSAVGKAEAFIIVFLKDSPCFEYIFIGDFDDIDYLWVKHLLADFNCMLVAKTLFDQIQCLNKKKGRKGSGLHP